MKIALLGSFPIYPYKDRVKFWFEHKNLTTYWNLNLGKALADVPETEVHFFVSSPLLRTKTIKDGKLFIHFVGHLPKLTWWNKITRLRYSKIMFHHLLCKLKPDIVYGIGTDHEYPYIAQTSRYPSLIKVGGVMREVVAKEKYSFFHINRTLATFEKRVVRNAKFIITPSNYVQELFKNHTNAKFFIVPNAVDLRFFEQEKSEKYDILYVGRIYSLKRLQNLIMAVQKISENGIGPSVFVAGGVGDSAYFEEIQQYIRQHNMESLFKFSGPLAQKELSGVMAKSKMLVVASVQETAPMIISEMMAIGKPIIGTNVGGIPEMIKDSVTGYVVEPENIEALADGIKRLLQSGSRRKEMGAKAKKIAQKLYHPDSVGQLNMKIFRHVINNN